MLWQKRGNIFSPDTHGYWAASHAQIPVVDTSMPGVWRIFYALRDSQNRSRISYFDVEPGRPEHILHVHDRALFELGAPGTFDDCGQMPTWITRVGDRRYMYYIGWNVRNTVPFHNAIGLACSDDGGHTYRKLFEGPVLDRSAEEPYFCGTACVVEKAGKWRMWYLSCTEWLEHAGHMEPRYHLKFATSSDGIRWQREGQVVIDYANAAEGGIAKASILSIGGREHMWYSFRQWRDYRQDSASAYRIGYARCTPDGSWMRQDAAGPCLDVSTEGWDSQMVCYPHVVEHDGILFMFYNGNGFGATGIGYATCPVSSLEVLSCQTP